MNMRLRYVLLLVVWIWATDGGDLLYLGKTDCL